MTKEEIVATLQEIFVDIFDDESIIVSDTLTADDVEGWDSLNHINLISAIERAFKVKFALGELQEMKNVGILIKLLEEKCA